MRSFRPGQGLNALRSVSGHGAKIYEMIVRRFLSIFYPPAVYQKVSLVSMIGKERFFSNFRILQEPGIPQGGRYAEGEKERRKGMVKTWMRIRPF